MRPFDSSLTVVLETLLAKPKPPSLLAKPKPPSLLAKPKTTSDGGEVGQLVVITRSPLPLQATKTNRPLPNVTQHRAYCARVQLNRT
jgi:hypothetical protein